MVVMSDVLPDNLVAYRRTPIFDQDSLPAALRRRHTTKDDVWGLSLSVQEQRHEHRCGDLS